MNYDFNFCSFPLRFLYCRLFVILSLCCLLGEQASALVIGAENNHPLQPPKTTTSNKLVDHEPEKLVTTSILLNIGYDGSHYTGWSAANKSQRSVQGELKKKLAKIFGNLNPDCVIVEGCSRTDKGVHASGMVAQAYAIAPAALIAVQMGEESLLSLPYSNQPSIPGKRYPHPWNSTDMTDCFVPILVPTSKIGFALNRMSGDDLRVFAIAPTPTITGNVPFHPTMHARSKTYQYTISTGSLADPIRRKRLWHVGKVNDESSLFMERMQTASRLLEEFEIIRHSPVILKDHKIVDDEKQKTTVVFVTYLPSRLHALSIHGDRFLYKMVRMLVGTIVAAGMGDIIESQIKAALESGERLPNRVECAPAHGLVLEKIDYDHLIEWEPVNS